MIDTKRVKSNIIFGDLNFEDYNAFAFGCNLFDRPERSVEVIQIPGRNGDLVLDNGKYNNIDRVYHVQVTGIRNIDALMSRLGSMVGYYRLEDEYEPDVYFTARLKTPPEILQIVGENAHLLVTLDRYPQKWMKSTENSVHPTYLGKSNNYELLKRTEASTGRVLNENIHKAFFKFVITNPMQNDVYGTLRFFVPAIPLDTKVGWAPTGFCVMKLGINVSSPDSAGLLNADLNGLNYYVFPPDQLIGSASRYNVNNNMLFFIRQNISNFDTEIGIGGDDGDYIEYDLETNTLVCSERLKDENSFAVVQWSAAEAIKPGENYLYFALENDVEISSIYSNFIQEIISKSTLSLRLYEI